jgi:polar amino acid transport system substrate-binding protein
MFYSKQRASRIDFSIPHSAVTYAVFVRKGERKIGPENSLAGHVVFAQQDDIASELLEGQGIKSVPVPDTQTAMKKLASGTGDAVVAAKSVGLYVIREQGIRNVEAVGSAFPQQQYCFAVRRNRTDGLLEKLNEGLTVLKYNGEQERIAAKWLSPWESSGVALRIVLLVVGSLLLLLAAAFAWSWMLRRKV